MRIQSEPYSKILCLKQCKPGCCSVLEHLPSMQRAPRFNIQHPKEKEVEEEKREARFWERAQQVGVLVALEVA